MSAHWNETNNTPPLSDCWKRELPDNKHTVTVECVEDESFITVSHAMTKTHFISFIAYITGDWMQLVKLYPEGNAETQLSLRSAGILYLYCNRHGLMAMRPKRT